MLICSVGSVVCNSDNPISVADRFVGQMVVFDITIPIIVGYTVSYYGDYFLGYLVLSQSECHCHCY